MKKILLGFLILFSSVSADITTLEGAKKACDKGNAKGCSGLGLMYSNGRGVKQDYFKAVEFYTKGCYEGNARGCTNLGVMYYNAQGVKKDYFKAKKLFSKACDGGYAQGCKYYSILNKK